MNENQTFITNAKIADIPWHRLATTYGRATDFPWYFGALLDSDLKSADKAGEQLELNIQHQSTLWPATPFALIFLVRIFLEILDDEKLRRTHKSIAHNLLELFITAAEDCRMGDGMDHAQPLPLFKDMLMEQYLWSEVYDEEEDEARYEEEEGPFSGEQFYSFYHYSMEVLKFHSPQLKMHALCDDSELSDKINRLLSLMY